jgi:hypothetical protein
MENVFLCNESAELNIFYTYLGMFYTAYESFIHICRIVVHF